MMKLTDIPVGIRCCIGKGSLPLLLLLCLTTACSFGRTSSATDTYQPIRSPYPTFTPTPIVLAQGELSTPPAATLATENASAANTPAPPVAVDATAVPTDPPAAEPTAAPAPPRLVVNAPIVNVRTGPSTEYEVLTTVDRGQEYDIIGKNAAGDWWRFCCINDKPAWINNELVDVDGAVELAPVTDEVAQNVPANTPVPAATQPPAAAATQAPAAPATEPEPATEEPAQPPAVPEFAFELVSAEQFSEPKVVRIFLYVYDGEEALAGYTVHVKKDGADQTVSGTSNGQPGFTWPIANPRQRFQNMKVEFPTVASSGVWEIQLVDGGGNAVGPTTTFTLTANDANQELYVRYKKR